MLASMTQIVLGFIKESEERDSIRHGVWYVYCQLIQQAVLHTSREPKKEVR